MQASKFNSEQWRTVRVQGADRPQAKFKDLAKATDRRLADRPQESTGPSTAKAPKPQGGLSGSRPQTVCKNENAQQSIQQNWTKKELDAGGPSAVKMADRPHLKNQQIQEHS
jgi:hypothetical protein